MPERDARFWAKVDKDGPTLPGMTTACWLWTGSRDRKGYGKLGRVIDGKLKPLIASRYSLEMSLGRALAQGVQACHRCDNPPCVRPDHLFEGTNADNQRDAVAKGRSGMQQHPDRCRVVGERHGQSKLTNAQVAVIRRRYFEGGRAGSRTAKGGITQQALADEYGVGVARICEIVNRKAWTHVEDFNASA